MYSWSLQLLGPLNLCACKSFHRITDEVQNRPLTLYEPQNVRLFTFMLLYIVIDLFLNNQPDALIISILFCYKTPHVSGISTHLQEFSTVHSALVGFMQVFEDSFQAESVCSVPTLLGSGHQKPA